MCGTRTALVVEAFWRRTLGIDLDAERSRHAEVHDQDIARRELGQQILSTAAKRLHRLALEARGKFPRQSNSQIRTAHQNPLEARPFHDRLQRAAHRFDFRELRQCIVPVQPVDAALVSSVQGSRVFVAGLAASASGDTDTELRAYDAESGALLWSDESDGGGFDELLDVEAAGGRVFTCGVVSTAAGNDDWIVRAHDAATGALLWEDRLDVAGGRDAAFDLDVRGQVVVAAGYGTTKDPALA